MVQSDMDPSPPVLRPDVWSRARTRYAPGGKPASELATPSGACPARPAPDAPSHGAVRYRPSASMPSGAASRGRAARLGEVAVALEAAQRRRRLGVELPVTRHARRPELDLRAAQVTPDRDRGR